MNTPHTKKHLVNMAAQALSVFGLLVVAFVALQQSTTQTTTNSNSAPDATGSLGGE